MYRIHSWDKIHMVNFKYRIHLPIHIEIIFSWLDFPIFFLGNWSWTANGKIQLLLERRYYENVSSPRRFITLKLYSFSSAERLQSNLQKTKSEGHNINVISDIPTLQQFLDIVANFLFPLFPLENTKNSQIQIYKKSRLFTRSTKWVFTCFPVQKKRSRPAFISVKSVYLQIHISKAPNCIRNVSKLQKAICHESKTIASIFVWT